MIKRTLANIGWQQILQNISIYYVIKNIRLNMDILTKHADHGW